MSPRQHPMVRMLARQLERLHDRGLIDQKDKKVIKDAIDVLKGNSLHVSPSTSNQEIIESEILAEHQSLLSNRCPTCGRITLIKPN